MNTLLHFKQGLIDPSDMISSWFPKLDCCHWKGVKCDNITGRVIELHLPCHTNQPQFLDFGDKEDKSNCLTGKFSLTLLELEFLSYLNFSNNDFKSIQYRSMSSHKCDGLSRGNLPHLCGNSTNLLYLDLSYNFDLFFDNLHWISHLSSLQYLNLGGVHLHKEIDWLQSVTMLPSLLELHLESCQLENIYPSLHCANLTSLQVLNLADNSFVSDEFPSWLFNLSSDISQIDLSQNQIHGQLPKILPKLRSIKSLILSSNYLKGIIPNWFGQLEQLQELDLSNNFLSGPIPESLGNISSLIELILELNELNGSLPDDLGQLFNLETLLVSENLFTGIVYDRNLLSSANLKHFSMSSAALIFDCDPEWSNKILGELVGAECRGLQLRSNQFSGNIPTQICKLRSLMVIDFASNKLSGPIPNCLRNITAMLAGYNSTQTVDSILKVPGTQSLQFGSGISMLVKGNELQYHMMMNAIDLSSNNLSGNVPLEMYMLTGLQSLNLSHNQLMGTIPQEIGNMLELELNDHRRCSHMIANALDEDGKFTPAQVSRKLKQLGLSIPRKKNSGGKMNPKGADLLDCSNDKMNESDDEALISLVKRKKMENSKLSTRQLHGQTSGDRLSTDDSDDELLSSVLRENRVVPMMSSQVEYPQMDDLADSEDEHFPTMLDPEGS
ncbi:hypothetical protein Fmac_023657 [Flemingia macrophylla]|uniref:Leucine-rich repeat-containing N-terminal plant-type domain-containing protein n=1 Tax=Flemingia macrophylla TaxID=520843 RepID=A0ABD1LM51_9FABA